MSSFMERLLRQQGLIKNQNNPANKAITTQHKKAGHHNKYNNRLGIL